MRHVCSTSICVSRLCHFQVRGTCLPHSGVYYAIVTPTNVKLPGMFHAFITSACVSRRCHLRVCVTFFVISPYESCLCHLKEWITPMPPSDMLFAHSIFMSCLFHFRANVTPLSPLNLCHAFSTCMNLSRLCLVQVCFAHIYSSRCCFACLYVALLQHLRMYHANTIAMSCHFTSLLCYGSVSRCVVTSSFASRH